MDRDAIVARCETRFKDPTNRAIEAAEWADYVNDAYDDILTQFDWPFLEARNTSTSITSGTNSADLPTGVWRVLSVFNATDDTAMYPIDGRSTVRQHFPDLTATGAPTYYRIFSDTIEVFPAADANKTLHIDHLVHPAALGASDEPVFPRPYHKILVDGALHYAYTDDGNLQQAESTRARFEAGIGRLANDLLSPRAENYPTIVDVW